MQGDDRPRLSHLDQDGRARMVDVGSKPETEREACASSVCWLDPETANLVRQNGLKKGDVLQVARLAGIQAAKRTDELIPLCHSLLLEKIGLDFEWLEQTAESKRVGLKITCRVKAFGKTGVEMEALVATSVAALAVYDMCKSSDRSIRISDTQLISKSGGTRGDYDMGDRQLEEMERRQ